MTRRLRIFGRMSVISGRWYGPLSWRSCLDFVWNHGMHRSLHRLFYSFPSVLMLSPSLWRAQSLSTLSLFFASCSPTWPPGPASQCCALVPLTHSSPSLMVFFVGVDSVHTHCRCCMHQRGHAMHFRDSSIPSQFVTISSQPGSPSSSGNQPSHARRQPLRTTCGLHGHRGFGGGCPSQFPSQRATGASID
ncbi:hypothetical protein EV363DRAFT_856137 [Boletus edulis]|nr:hypothetical protein EV363DRAFT_856137 [Boletus edulis]